jgi:hypothetical protein
MNTKLKTILAAATLAAIGFLPSANAQILLTSGDVTFSLTFRSEGTTPAGQARNGKVNPAAPVTNPAFVQYPGDVPGNRTEDTWGIFEVNSIVQGLSTKFDPAMSGYRLFGLFYGSVDQSQTALIPVTTGGVTVYQQTFTSQGLRLDIYRTPLGTPFTNEIALGSAGHTALNQFTGITDVGNPLFLSAALNGNLVSTTTYNDPAGFDLRNSTSSGVLNTTYTNPALITFNPGTTLTTFDFSVESQITTNSADFILAGTSSVIGTVSAVPEPSTYALFGVVALMGLVAVRRIRSSKLVRE